MTSRRRASTRPPVPPTGALPDPGELKRLAALMAESGLVELEIERAGERVRLVRAVSPPPTAAEAPPVTRGIRRESEADGGASTITSPMVGTFHRAPAPEAPAFVEVGDVVERGQVLCLVEAMKMMNEIEAEFRGRVTAILVDNGRAIEYGEALFLVEPV